MAIESNRYRLRIENKIVGYRKQIHTSIFYSKDQYAWNGLEIDFQIKDKFTGFYDLNRRAIYVEDIIELKDYKHCEFGLLLYDEKLEGFQIMNLSTEEFLADNIEILMNPNSFVFKSYHFIQPKV